MGARVQRGASALGQVTPGAANTNPSRFPLKVAFSAGIASAAGIPSICASFSMSASTTNLEKLLA